MNRLSTIDEEEYEVEKKRMATTIVEDGEGSGDIQPYTMHVSSKYLELTRRKLELTRLPREVSLPEDEQWKLGTPKSELEPLIDFWLEKYDWRAQESHINARLPQFRTFVEIPGSSSAPTHDEETGEGQSSKLRIHFVHKRSTNANAVPLLFCHTWPGSFLDILPIIDTLTVPQPMSPSVSSPNPQSTSEGEQPSHPLPQSFHIVAPSIPGFGFSDASEDENFGAKEAAAVFDALMKKLGYSRYLVHGSGSSWPIARYLALHHASSCAAVHTQSPRFPQPHYNANPQAWWKWRLAVLSGARLPWLAFGYTPADVKHWIGTTRTTGSGRVKEPDLETGLSTHPQTPSFALCDSPAGLLALILDSLHQNTTTTRAATDTTSILNRVMLYWLPGPEAALRYLRSTRLAHSQLYKSYTHVPLGVSSFSWEAEEHGPVLWGEGWQNLVWARKRHGSVSVYAGRSGDGRRCDYDAEIVSDLRDFVGTLMKEGWAGDWGRRVEEV